MIQILQGDCLERLRELPEDSVQCVVTSPPYWGLRDYGVDGQIGLERTPEDYIAKMVEVFREVCRVLRKDGTCWLNLGDCYVSAPQGPGMSSCGLDGTRRNMAQVRRANGPFLNGRGEPQKVPTKNEVGLIAPPNRKRLQGLKSKDLVGIPWRVAFALQADGWWLRSDIIWHKPNPMPESVTDRPTKSHEYLFLLTKSATYFYDAQAIREPPSPALIKQIEEGYNGHSTKDFANGLAQDASGTKARIIEGYRKRIDKQRGHSRRHAGFNDRWDKMTVAEQRACGSNKRTVWTVPTAPYKEAHFATFPPDLIKPCIMAGSRPGDVVLDPFGGSGTTGAVALELGRPAILIELNPEYVALSERRCTVTPGLAI